MPNRSVYVIGAPWRDNWVTKEAAPWLAPRPAPATAGVSRLVSRFLPTRELTNNNISLYRTTSAKTRATPKRRQQHIPPNVSNNSELHHENYIRFIDCYLSTSYLLYAE